MPTLADSPAIIDPEDSAFGAMLALEGNDPGLDQALPDGRVPRAIYQDTLATYVSDRRARGLQVFPTHTARANRERSTYLRNLYLKPLAETLPPEAVSRLESHKALHPDPAAFEAREVNRAYLTAITGSPLDGEALNLARDRYARLHLGLDKDTSDAAVFAAIQGRFKEDDAASAAFSAHLEQSLAKRITSIGRLGQTLTDGQTGPAQTPADGSPARADLSYRPSLEERDAFLAKLPERSREEYRSRWNESQRELSRLFRRHEGLVADIVRGVGQINQDPNPDAALMTDLGRWSARIPPGREGEIVLAMVGNALSTQLPEDGRSSIERIAQGVYRGLQEAGSSMVSAARYEARQLLPEATTEALSFTRDATLEERTRQDKLLQAIRGQGMSLAKVSDNLIESSFVAMAPSAWMFPAAVSPVGQAAIAQTMAGSSMQAAAIANPEVPESLRTNAGLASGMVQGAIESLSNITGLKILTGKLPSFSKLLNSAAIAAPAGRAALGFAAGYTATAGIEYLEEAAQGGTDLYFQSLAQDLAGNKPQIDWTGYFAGWFGRQKNPDGSWQWGLGEEQRQTLLAVSAMGMIAGAGASLSHFRNGSAIAQSKAFLRANGFTEEQVRDVVTTEDPDQAAAKIASHFETQQAAAKQDPNEAQRQQQQRTEYLAALRAHNEALNAAGLPRIVRERNSFTETDSWVFLDPATASRVPYETEEEALDALANWRSSQTESDLEAIQQAARGDMLEWQTTEGNLGESVNVRETDRSMSLATVQADMQAETKAAEADLRKATSPLQQRRAQERLDSAQTKLQWLKARIEVMLFDQGIPAAKAGEALRQATILGRVFAERVMDRVVGYTVELFRGADVGDIAEEFSEATIREAVDQGFCDPEILLDDIRRYEKASGAKVINPSYQYDPANPVPLFEGFSKLARGYMLSQVRSGLLPPTVAKWIEMQTAIQAATVNLGGGLASNFALDVQTAGELREAMAAGFIPPRLEQKLRDSIGLDPAAQQQRLQKRMEEQLAAEAMGDFPQLAEEAQGRLPHPETLRENNHPLYGEVRRLWESLKRPTRRRTKDGRAIDRTNEANAFFLPVGQMVDLDQVRQSLNDQGFNLDTVTDLLDALDYSLSYGKPFYATRAPAAAGETYSIGIAAKLAQESRNAAALADEEFFSAFWPRLLKLAGQKLKPSLRNINEAATRAVDDILEWIHNNPRFLDYYNKDWDNTRNVLRQYLPDLTDDEFIGFRLFTGLTSPSTPLDGNIADAVQLLDLWRRERSLRSLTLTPSAKGARSAGPGPFKLRSNTGATKIFSLHAVNTLFDQLGSWEAVSDYLSQPVSPRELHDFNRKMGYSGDASGIGNIRRVVKEATGQDDLIPRMFIFGQKVGAYTLNTTGDHRYTTTDIWESRFIRSYFPQMFKTSTGLPVNEAEHTIFQRFASAFNQRFAEAVGLNLEPSALQAARWFYMLNQAKGAGYRHAKTDKTISEYTLRAARTYLGGNHHGRGQGRDGGRDRTEPGGSRRARATAAQGQAVGAASYSLAAGSSPATTGTPSAAGETWAISPIGPGLKPITSAPEVVELASPFAADVSEPSVLRREFWAKFPEFTASWPETIQTDEGPIAWSKAKTLNKLRSFKNGEPALLHFIAAANLPELLRNSKLASVEPELKGDKSVQEIHRRYAWSVFPNGQRRHVLLTVERMSEHARPEDQTVDLAYSSEVLGVSLEILPENKSADVVPSEAIKGETSSGVRTVTSTPRQLAMFLAGVKPEHRWTGEKSDPSTYAIAPFPVPNRETVQAYLDSNGTPPEASIQESERVFTTLAQLASGALGESGAASAPPDFLSSGGGQGGSSPGHQVAMAGSSTAAALSAQPAGASPDLLAGLTGDWDALAREVNQRGRASSILAELINRDIPSWSLIGTKLLSSADVHAVMLPIRSPYFESLKVMVLDDNLEVVHAQILSVGTVSQTVAEPSEIFGLLARIRQATGKDHRNLIISHNHPSGDPSPSRADELITRRMDEIATATGWNVVDHVITNGETHYSFRNGWGLTQPAPAGYTSNAATSNLGQQAPWETVKRSGLPLINDETIAARAAAALRNANPDAAHLIYATTRLNLLGVEQVDVAVLRDRSRLAQTLIAGKDREAASSFFAILPASLPRAEAAAMVRLIKDSSQLLGFPINDAIHPDTTGSGFYSARASGLLEPSTPYTYAIGLQGVLTLDAAIAKRMTRGPDERAEFFEKLRNRLAATVLRLREAKHNLATADDPAERERFRIRDAMAEARAVVEALPAEARGKVQFAVNEVIDAQSERGQINALIRLIDKADEALETVLLKEYREAFETLLDLAKPDLRQNKQVRGRLTPKTQRLVGLIYEATILSPEQLAVELTRVEAEITALEASNPQQPEEIAAAQSALADLYVHQNLLETFGAFSRLDAAQTAHAYQQLQGIYVSGRTARRILDEARRAEIDAAKREVLDSLPATTQADHALRTSDKGFLDFIGAYNLGMASFHQVMERLFPRSTVARDFQERVRAADRAFVRAKINARQRFDDFTFAAWNLAGRSRSRRRNAILASLSRLRDDWKVRLAEGAAFTSEKLTEEQAEAIVQGRIKTGWETDPIAMTSLRQALADFRMQRLKARNEDKQFRSTVIRFQRITRRGTPGPFVASDLQALYLLQLYAQEQYRPALDKYGFTETVIESIRLSIDPRALDLGDFLRTEYDAEWDRLNPVYRSIYGLDMPRIRNYAPGLFEHLDAKGPGTDSTIDMAGQPAPVNAMSAGFTKARTHHMARPRLTNAMAAYWSHLEATEYFIAYAELMRDARQIFRQPELRRRIEARFGLRVADIFSKWLDALEVDGNFRAVESLALTEITHRALATQSAVGLAYNVGVLFKQVSAATGVLLEMPHKDAAIGLMRAIRSPQSFREVWSSEAIQQRILSGISPEDRKLLDAAKASPSLLMELLELGRLPIALVDAAFTTVSATVAYSYHLGQALKSGLSQTAAQQVALAASSRVIERTAQPATTQDKSLNEITAKGFGRFLFLFKSDPRQKLAIVANAIQDARAGRKPWGTAGRKLLWGWLLYGLSSELMSDIWASISRDDDDPEQWAWNDYLAAMIAGPVAAIPMLGQGAEFLTRALVGSKAFSTSPNPIDAGISRLPSTSAKLLKLIDGNEDFSVNDILTAAQQFAAALSLPAGVADPRVAIVPAALRILRDAQGAISNLAGMLIGPSQDDLQLEVIRKIQDSDKVTRDTARKNTDQLARELAKLDPAARSKRMAKLDSTTRAAIHRRLRAPLMRPSEAALARLSAEGRRAAVAAILERLPAAERPAYLDRLKTLGLAEP